MRGRCMTASDGDSPTGPIDKLEAVEVPRRMWLTVCAAVVAFVGVAALIVCVVAAFTVPRPTLRPIAASESMSDGQARAVAEATVRLWMSERNEHHQGNMAELTCHSDAGTTALYQLRHLTDNNAIGMLEALGFGDFTRKPGEWRLYVFINKSTTGDSTRIFRFQIQDGGLRVCDVMNLKVAEL
ncbi:Uncharacterised protein [Mycobacteroides abscessus subsp. abscessus]|nr:Uncharacterised protein [Mycobacteroides abscessus subsp. abscessus]SHS90558.1 Uncharacterised protein [Mycobacteroides abscessus subsp. abscessus]SHT36821.1 Uncharacterised protein [Mycobacteroides abscessus subsp. abscessus]SHT40444.1 Uncharacterised protein [Mycobacteroides abscessus subsp. abscessus]SHT63412.1 Uncharacterised protein [Mycobacteroides abscessus subsp. abscessus]